MTDPTGPVDTVLFDLDDTLCAYHRSGGELLALAFEDVGVDPFFTVEEYHARYSEFVAASDDIRDLREACFAALSETRGRDPAVGRAVAEAYAAERDHRAVAPMPGAHDAIDSLREDHRIGMVTNGDPWMQRQKLDSLGLEDAFETIVHGGYDTAPKPEPDPFYRALDDLGASADRAVHVGNSLYSDVPGANAAGVRSVWFTGGEVGGGTDPDPTPTYRLDSLSALTDPPWR
jgi:putative hydrolase of the HAD superfamily